MERRVLGVHEIRAAKSADGKMTVKGYAARYGVLSHPLPAGNGQIVSEAQKDRHQAFRTRNQMGVY